MIARKSLLAMIAGAWVTQASATPRTAFVHLFEWSWDDVAEECEQVLGPKGFAAVQVSPPQKSINGGAWWTRYQPISYEIVGRSGNRSQFQSMVNRCQAVGVDIYVDAVINHMAASGNRNYPEVPYGPNDFNYCGSPIDYYDRYKVQFCDLVGLNDLKTSSDYVQGKIADYLNDLTRMGVKGFRIDAAKHIPAGDVRAIVSRLEGNPYIFQEVIEAFGEPVRPEEYVGNGNVTEFRFEREMGAIFKGFKPLKELQWINRKGWLRSDQAVVFVSNHDDQRQYPERTLTYKDVGNLYYIAEIAMLAYPYGYPKVMSSYYFSDKDQGPPSRGPNTGDRCFDGGWVCEHRWNGIANMVEFRNQTAGEWRLSHWWDDGSNQIAFGRGGLGFVAINRNDFQSLNQRLQTGMPAGEYCDIVHGNFDKATGLCDGPTVTVDGSGFASFDVATIDAVAIHVGAKVGKSQGGDNGSTPLPPPEGSRDITFICDNGETVLGQSVFVVGNIPELGNWKASQAIKIDPDNYPQWEGTVTIDSNGTVEWKCIKGQDDSPASGTVWQSGPNNTLNPAGSSSTRGSF
ncbi:carbohydrate-binding module family 20 domain-containing protein [Pseudobacteriovorax antillogorgiicola]|uniref:Alpha-amylase n=1 Tax=Pseudobacteriovorax antillogorgiicola TaxID=1513793 RepID=A0A1Y6BZK2_9BACT|nr:carbohydrate-binding module family 20 domain-containing protein [Pseudobacteriovorax antillogorgiicola]TCS53056.1 alpha-amylase [Pseudobacteriovorax antillogorgiicola]SMF26375.1 alpha-amylase [Pseudobacteriovorax antillogorgiicola]